MPVPLTGTSAKLFLATLSPSKPLTCLWVMNLVITSLLDRAEFVRAKSRVKAELSRINGEVEILKACSRETETLTVGELLRRAWDANESITWRGALIKRAIERIEVFPGIRKPFVNVDGVTMRFDKDRVKIIWRQKDGASSPAA